MSTAQNGQIVTNGLVLALDAANDRSYVSGSSVWRDLTANGNNGTLTNGPTFNSTNLGGIQFDGTNDYVLVNSGSTNINPTSAITICASFNVSSYGGSYAPIVFKQNNYGSKFEQYILAIINTSAIATTITGIDRNQVGITSPLGNINKNVHATVTCDTIAKELKLYINSVLIQTVAFTSTFDIADTPINIGGSGVLKFGATFNGWTNGKIYQILLYNRALTATEVLQNYNATKTRFGL